MLRKVHWMFFSREKPLDKQGKCPLEMQIKRQVSNLDLWNIQQSQLLAQFFTNGMLNYTKRNPKLGKQPLMTCVLPKPILRMDKIVQTDEISESAVKSGKHSKASRTATSSSQKPKREKRDSLLSNELIALIKDNNTIMMRNENSTSRLTRSVTRSQNISQQVSKIIQFS